MGKRFAFANGLGLAELPLDPVGPISTEKMASLSCIAVGRGRETCLCGLDGVNCLC